ncbi:MAG: sigma-70 family RNA polymerase sigma factor [Armatimonadetes bacterium]|nr:sigma-70 family RNA polymerase sigma factor [Armatimonadota bacterium]
MSSPYVPERTQTAEPSSSPFFACEEPQEIPLTSGDFTFPISDSQRQVLFQDFQPLVKRLIRQYGDSHDQRQDLEGEIYFRFCTLLEEYDPERGIPLRAYLVRKLITSAYTYARSQWRRQRHEVSLEFRMESGVEGGEAARPVDPTMEWTNGLMKNELLGVIQEAIGKLPQRQQQVVIWRYYESKPFNEIAEMLGVCEATARSLLRHGINNIRRRIKHSQHWQE